MPVLPVLFYHGKAPWTLPERLSGVLLPPAVLAPSSPDFSLSVIDMARIDDREIQNRLEDLSAILALLALKHIYDDLDRCLRILLQEVRKRKAAYGILKPELAYLTSYHGITRPEDVVKTLVPIFREEGMAPNVIDQMFEEATQKGVQQGIQQGAREEQDRVVRALLARGLLSPEEIARTLGMDLFRVHALAREAKEPS